MRFDIDVTDVAVFVGDNTVHMGCVCCVCCAVYYGIGNVCVDILIVVHDTVATDVRVACGVICVW